jgi:hypothetical protein
MQQGTFYRRGQAPVTIDWKLRAEPMVMLDDAKREHRRSEWLVRFGIYAGAAAVIALAWGAVVYGIWRVTR